MEQGTSSALGTRRPIDKFAPLTIVVLTTSSFHNALVLSLARTDPIQIEAHLRLRNLSMASAHRRKLPTASGKRRWTLSTTATAIRLWSTAGIPAQVNLKSRLEAEAQASLVHVL